MIYVLPVLAVLLSFVFVYYTRPKRKDNFRLLLAFSGAFLLALTVFELLPGLYDGTNGKRLGVFIMIGILLQIFLEFFSRGAEHGHMHYGSQGRTFPWLLFLSLSIHALLEGVPIGDNPKIIYGILIHKIPIAIILSIFLLASKMKLPSMLFFVLAFSVMTPLGSFLAIKLPLPPVWVSYLNAMAIGVFFHISTVILFESSEGHKFNLRKLTVILLGVILAYLI